MMRSVLYILTQPQDSLAHELMARQGNDPDLQLVIADLTLPEPDYDRLLEQIFAADSVQVW